MILFLTFINTRGLPNRKDHSEHFYVYENRCAARFDSGRIVPGLEYGSAAYTSSWWASWENGWKPSASQVWFEPATTGLLVLALLMLLGRAMVGPLFAQSAWNNVTFTAAKCAIRARTCRARCCWVAAWW